MSRVWIGQAERAHTPRRLPDHHLLRCHRSLRLAQDARGNDTRPRVCGCRLAGAQVYLTKPITTQAIIKVVQEVLDPSLNEDNDRHQEQEAERFAISGGQR